MLLCDVAWLVVLALRDALLKHQLPGISFDVTAFPSLPFCAAALHSQHGGGRPDALTAKALRGAVRQRGGRNSGRSGLAPLDGDPRE